MQFNRETHYPKISLRLENLKDLERDRALQGSPEQQDLKQQMLTDFGKYQLPGFKASLSTVVLERRHSIR